MSNKENRYLANNIKSISSSFSSGSFGIVLGLIGIGMAWRYEAKEYGYPSYLSEIFIGAGCTVWLLLTLQLLTKLACDKNAIFDELKHPINSGFISLLPASTVLVAIGLSPYFKLFSIGLFSIGAVSQLIYACWLTGCQWKGVYPKAAVTPVLYLPTVANNFICTMACGAFGFIELGTLFFGAGVFSWLSLESSILNRVRSYGLMDEKGRLSLGIQLSPALVACNAYLAINNNHIDFFAKMLLGYGILQLLFLIRLIPWFIKQSFTLSFWSFSFGISALSKASFNLAMTSESIFLKVFATLLFIFANIFILLLIVNSLLFIKNKYKKVTR